MPFATSPDRRSSLSSAFTTTSTYVEGYIQNTSDNVNHGITLDGKLAVWVVKVTSNGSVSTTSAAYVIFPPRLLVYSCMPIVSRAPFLNLILTRASSVCSSLQLWSCERPQELGDDGRDGARAGGGRTDDRCLSPASPVCADACAYNAPAARCYS